LPLVGGSVDRVRLAGPAVPGGLAVKLFPCCYALQRPIAALREQLSGVDTTRVVAVEVRTPAGTVQPLIHHRPRTGLQGKFSLEYAMAAALLDEWPGFASFTDGAVLRAEAQRLVRLVEVDATPGGEWLLAGEVAITVRTDGGGEHKARLELPPGSPGRPPSLRQLAAKVADCGADVPRLLAGLDWARAAEILRVHVR
jgi:2-methylcitrate dehydratase PrpD